MRIFGIFTTILLILRIRICHALDCHECGSLSIIPGGTDGRCSDSSDQPTSSMARCSIDLTHTRSFKDLYQSSETREVCYTLTGKFRGEDIVMRGCDAISSGDINKCFHDEIGVWFDTERGREYITDKVFCTCGGEDLCNDDTLGGSSCHHFVSTLLMLIPITLVVLSGY